MWMLSRCQTQRKLRQSYSQLELLVRERTAALQNLSQRLLRVQDEERRRVARDLHDSTGQTLTGLKISVAILQRKLENNPYAHAELSGIARLADQALQEIRTTSHLLHPPLLDEVGLTSAAQWYVEGFARRSGVKASMDFAPEVERLPDAIEIALFRVLQESLTNVHRHSEASEVEIRLRREAEAVILEVRDYGRGIPQAFVGPGAVPTRDFGVGLAGMRERLNELNGRLEIEPADPGTRLRAIVPLLAQAACPAETGVPAEVSVVATAPRELPIRQWTRARMTQGLKHVPLHVAVSVVIAALVLFYGDGNTNRPFLATSGLLRRSNSVQKQPRFASPKPADSLAKLETGRIEKTQETHPAAPQRRVRNRAVDYIAADMTLRYGALQAGPVQLKQPVGSLNESVAQDIEPPLVSLSVQQPEIKEILLLRDGPEAKQVSTPDKKCEQEHFGRRLACWLHQVCPIRKLGS